MAGKDTKKKKRRQRINVNKIKSRKLAAMMLIILLAFAGLGVRLYFITRDSQNDYQKKILSQQRYDSTTLPFKRGTITDANGTILAVSEKVYNVVLDCKVMLDDEKNAEPTLTALSECFGLNLTELRQYAEQNPNSQYYVLKRRITYDEMSPFLDRKNEYNAEASKKGNEEMGNISGVWFEEEYIRRYPNNTLACDVIGFTGTDNNGTYGLEEYYNDTLNGTNGREYGYLNDDATLERTTVAAVDGSSLVSTLDANIQAICEKYIKQFNDEHLNEAREGLGATNIGVIIQDCNNGEIKAMASYPNYDLNDTKNSSQLIGMQRLDADGKKTGEIINEEMLAQIEEEGLTYLHLDALWKNFCISDSYEPGSTAKSLTLAMGLETGRIVGNETYECSGALDVSDRHIRCNVRSGHGTLDVSGALEQSCNVAFMKMGEAIGVKNTIQFEQIFNIGLRTNIDLAGEARTASLVFNEDTMGPTELATSSFGQGYNVTMIEMATAFSSIINGGYYYEPHLVNRITNSNGDVVKNIEPRVLKQTISSTTSEQMRQYLYAAVAEGTGKSARPAGYAIGGKTGTAEKAARDKKNYVVSFIGFAPADDPQIVIYCVVDEPNVADQPHATYATGIVKNILTEVLPYMHISKTEEMTIAEQEEVENVLGYLGQEDSSETGDENAEGENAEGTENGESTEAESGESSESGNTSNYVVDPDTGELVNPETGEKAEMDYNYSAEDGEESGSTEGENSGGTSQEVSLED
ncbi:MAG: penicillin-binding protein 2 [Lachnospiraceae bacterium]|nr:penicillin-binding protein 2 [Lachnospiraceae bacterium]MBO5145901.1 penicillin-binding protein 2 [Lachnospiraceae bacterium]